LRFDEMYTRRESDLPEARPGSTKTMNNDKKY
jgi:hypothetical protein